MLVMLKGGLDWWFYMVWGGLIILKRSLIKAMQHQMQPIATINAPQSQGDGIGWKPPLKKKNNYIINTINSDHFPISTSLVSGNHFEGGAFSALPLRGVKSKAPSPIFKADSARILGGVICGLSGRQCQPRIHRPWQPWSVSLVGVIFFH